MSSISNLGQEWKKRLYELYTLDAVRIQAISRKLIGPLRYGDNEMRRMLDERNVQINLLRLPTILITNPDGTCLPPTPKPPITYNIFWTYKQNQ